MIFRISFLILSLIVEVYLWWKLQASLIFLSWRTCTIGGWLNTFLPHCMFIYLPLHQKQFIMHAGNVIMKSVTSLFSYKWKCPSPKRERERERERETQKTYGVTLLSHRGCIEIQWESSDEEIQSRCDEFSFIVKTYFWPQWTGRNRNIMKASYNIKSSLLGSTLNR